MGAEVSSSSFPGLFAESLSNQYTETWQSISLTINSETIKQLPPTEKTKNEIPTK